MQEHRTTHRLLIAAIVLILLCVICFYTLLPILGIAVIMSGAAWGIVIATITLFAIACLLFFFIPGILIILLSFFAFGWVILAIALFPFLFPLVLPVFIILLFIAYMSRRRIPPVDKSEKPDVNNP